MSLVDILAVIGAVVAAVVGAFFGSWLRRSHPWAGIITISRDDSDLVAVPADLVATFLRRPLEQVQSQRMPLRRLRQLHEEAKTSADVAGRVLDRFRDARTKIEDRRADVDTKSRMMRAILGDSSIFSNISYVCRTGQLALPASVQVPDGSARLVQAEDCTSDASSEKAYVFYVDQGAKAVLRPGDGPVGQQMLMRIRNIGLVIEYQLEPHFSLLMSAVEREINADLRRFAEIRDRTADLIKSRSLVVRVHVTNTGGTPEHLGAHALLQLRGGGRPLQPVIATVRASRLHEAGFEDVQHMIDVVEGLAAKQGVEAPGERKTAKGGTQYVVVKPGDTVEVDLYTEGLVDQEHVISALEQGMLGARVILERMGRRWNRWLSTDWMVLGEAINEQKERELQELAQKYG
jgi:hypothetical protein